MVCVVAFLRQTGHNEDIPPNTLHSDSKVQVFLDDVSQASELMETAKRHVKTLVTADAVLIKSDPRYRAHRDTIKQLEQADN